eukprot:11756353-Alexandrium_andersonii.AAC.1
MAFLDALPDNVPHQVARHTHVVHVHGIKYNPLDMPPRNPNEGCHLREALDPFSMAHACRLPTSIGEHIAERTVRNLQ